jgi:hypothetical protein
MYAGQAGQTEVRIDGFRIDAVEDGRLIEIQHANLAAIRTKTAALLHRHRVVVVKPLVLRKRLVKLPARGLTPVSSRMSPKKARLVDIFHDLVHFIRVFPHERLTVECLLVEVEEIRRIIPPRHRRRWRPKDHRVLDQRLLEVVDRVRLATIEDLLALVSCPLPVTFTTRHLQCGLDVSMPLAQRMAYCFQQMGASTAVGKLGNSRLYQLCRPVRATDA